VKGAGNIVLRATNGQPEHGGVEIVFIERWLGVGIRRRTVWFYGVLSIRMT